MNFDLVAPVDGWLSRGEAQLLYDMAARCPVGGHIIEVGSYRGRSTLALAQAARERRATVWAIDPHSEQVEPVKGRTQFGVNDHIAFMETITQHGYWDTVRVVNLPSVQAARAWAGRVDMVFIDGLHDAQNAMLDFTSWSPRLSFKTGVIAFHDSTWEGPALAIAEAQRRGWCVIAQEGTITCLTQSS